ncbi:spectinomycin phosphotransferase [Kribbella aluminosa]|uniref:Spectinomycin phosphotransferase n=1 Tax=Kribbella aluminosa TaxID=416017 RepID=A0ABS4UD89_9ACTN|nr:phosphotransferase [Kribbella aluminosa]MBP2349545.1 spectinomycin phosphotransferase [Kribbella aluminosa]
MGDTLLRKWLLADFGLDVVQLTPVAYGADVAAQVWRATTATNSYAVKWSGAGTNTGHQVAAFLADSGLPGVPELIRMSEGGLWSVHAKKRLTVTPWIDGTRAAETGLTVEQWSEYGILLRRVHDAELPPRLLDALPKYSHIDARMPAVVDDVRRRLETPDGEVAEELAAVWKQYDDVLADLLTKRPPAPTGPRVVCHGDPHLGNVLVDKDLHLIDWDDVIHAPREQDLMFMLGGMGDVGPTTTAQREAFLAGYGPHVLDEEAVHYYRHVRAYEDVIGWSHQALTGPEEPYALQVTKGILTTGLAALAVQ